MLGKSETSHFDVSCRKYKRFCTSWKADDDGKIIRTAFSGFITQEKFLLFWRLSKKDEGRHCFYLKDHIEPWTVLYLIIEIFGSEVNVSAMDDCMYTHMPWNCFSSPTYEVIKPSYHAIYFCNFLMMGGVDLFSKLFVFIEALSEICK